MVSYLSCMISSKSWTKSEKTVDFAASFKVPSSANIGLGLLAVPLCINARVLSPYEEDLHVF